MSSSSSRTTSPSTRTGIEVWPETCLTIGALGVRVRDVDGLVIEQQVGQLLAHACAVRTPLGLVEDHIGFATHAVVRAGRSGKGCAALGVGLSHLAMHTGASSRRRDRTAIGGSIALHVCVLAALAVMPHSPRFPSEEPDERVLLTSLVRIQRPTAPPRPVVRRLTAVPPRVQPRPATPPPLDVAVTTEHARRALVVPAEHRYVPPAPPPTRHVVPARRTASAPLVVAAAAPPVAPPTASATPTAAPSATPGAGRARGRDRQLRRDLSGLARPAAARRADRGRGRIVVRVTVDERGRADRRRVRARAGRRRRCARRCTAALLAARYIPAACNGLRCSGTFEIRT